MLLVVAVTLVLAYRAGRSDAPPEPPAFAGVQLVEPVAVFDVQSVSAGSLSLQGGGTAQAIQFAPPAGAAVEFLGPTTPDTIVPGEVVTVIGIPNEVKSFSIRLVVVMPPGTKLDSDGIARSPSGFAGHESERDAKERPVLSGTVTAISGKVLTLSTPGNQLVHTLHLEMDPMKHPLDLRLVYDRLPIAP